MHSDNRTWLGDQIAKERELYRLGTKALRDEIDRLRDELAAANEAREQLQMALHVTSRNLAAAQARVANLEERIDMEEWLSGSGRLAAQLAAANERNAALQTAAIDYWNAAYTKSPTGEAASEALIALFEVDAVTHTLDLVGDE